MRTPSVVLACAALFASSGCHRSARSSMPLSGTSVVQENGFVVYAPARPRKQREQDSSSVTFLIPAPQQLSGVLKDPQSAVIAHLKMQLTCAGVKRTAETDYHGKFDLGALQPGECTFTFGPGPWLAPTVKCSTESCMVEPILTWKHVPKVIEN